MAFDRPALCLSGSYLLLGLAWIGLADRIVPAHAPEFQAAFHPGSGQGLIFICLTAGLLYFLTAHSTLGNALTAKPAAADGKGSLLRRILVPAAITVGLAGLGASYSLEKHKRLETQRLQLVAQLKSIQISDWLGERMAVAGILASDDVLLECYRRWRELPDADSRGRVARRLLTFQKSFGYANVALVNSGGEVVLATEASSGVVGSPRLGEAVQQAVMENRAVLSEAPLTREAGARGLLDIVVALPTTQSGSGQTRLAVVLRVDAQSILFPIPAPSLIFSRSTEIQLIRRDGAGAEVPANVRQAADSAPTPVRIDELAMRSTEGEATEFIDYRQTAVLGIGKAIPDTPWILVAKVDRGEIYAQAVADGIGIGAAGALPLAAAFLVVLARQRRAADASAAGRQQQAERAEMLQMLDAGIEGASDAIFAKDGGGRYLLLNGEALRILGKSRDAVLGKDDNALFAPAEAKRIMADDKSVMAKNESGIYDERVTTGNGSVVFQAMKAPLRDNAGNAVGVFGIARDVTGQQRLIEQLRASEARFRALTALSADWYWELDEQFRFCFYSEAFIDKLALLEGSEMIGRHPWDLTWLGISEAEWMAHRSRLARGEEFRDLEYGWRAPDGCQHYISVSGEPIFAADGRCTGYRGVARDISAHRQAEADLRQSEARLSAIIASALDGIVTLDQRRRISIFNPAAEAIFGYRSEEVLAQPADMLFLDSPDAGIEEECPVLPVAGIDHPDGIQTRYMLNGRHRSGRQIVLEASVSCHKAGAETLKTFVLRDVTPQLAAERRLRQLSTAVEQSPVSVVITDPGGVIEYVNPRFSQVSGYSFDEIRGRNIGIMKSGETAPAVYQQLWETIRSGGEWRGEMRNRKKSGELFWESVRIIPIVSPAGLVMNYMAVKEDITQRKDLETQERLRQEQMLHTARLISMGETAAALAHELNQPLTAIVNFSGVAERQLAADNPDLSCIRKVVRLITEQALHAGEIVWRIRDFLKKRDPKYEASDINSVIVDTVRLAEISLRDRLIPIETDLAPALPCAPADRVQLEQVLFNLIKNAVEATEEIGAGRPKEGLEAVRIMTRMLPSGEAIEVEVADRGCGLPNLMVLDIFAPFCSTKPQGMGMGLAICRGIVEAHGGKLTAVNNDHGGASFSFTLPIRETDNE